MQLQSIAMLAGSELGEQAELGPELLSNPVLVKAAFTALAEKLSGQLVPVQQAQQTADSRPDLKPLLTAKQVQELTGISRSEIYRMISSGVLPSSQVGEGTRCISRRVPKALILGFLADQAAGRVVSLRDYAQSWRKSIAASPAGPAMKAAS